MLECRLVNAKQAVRLLKNKFGNKFIVIPQERFYFDQTCYIPDITLRSIKNGAIKAIIEIEQCARKHVVGGVITADYCMGKERARPVICVFSLRSKNTKDYKKRIPMLKRYMKAHKDIVIGDKTEVFNALAKIKA